MKRDEDPYCECGLPLLGLDRIERERHRMSDRHLRRMAEEQRDRLQAAVDEAHADLHGAAYVGGPSERDAWRTAIAALGAVVTQHRGVPASDKNEASP